MAWAAIPGQRVGLRELPVPALMAWAALQLCLHPEGHGQSSVVFPGNPGGNSIAPVHVFVS